ncbi:MAG: transcriptional repressor LexA [Chloroflexi bacterium]|nr:transcriptional repressor LexA [Chloroflexota bacterium]MCL5109090.1 transcriptional repressor LexA [Chloroflexota bacterium]
MSSTRLSDRQRRIVEFIGDFLDEHGYPPTVRDIGRAVGISSTSVVDYNLKRLEREGYLKRVRDVSRGIELVGDGDRRSRGAFTEVPVIGRIAAGEPIEAVEERDRDRLLLSPSLAEEGCFALRVKGKSMIEDLIDDGDVVVVRPQSTADNGDIVVALLTEASDEPGRATLKRLYRERDRVRLQPANSALNPIFVDPASLRVQGKVVAVIRQM